MKTRNFLMILAILLVANSALGYDSVVEINIPTKGKITGVFQLVCLSPNFFDIGEHCFLPVWTENTETGKKTATIYGLDPTKNYWVAIKACDLIECAGLSDAIFYDRSPMTTYAFDFDVNGDGYLDRCKKTADGLILFKIYNNGFDSLTSYSGVMTGFGGSNFVPVSEMYDADGDGYIDLMMEDVSTGNIYIDLYADGFGGSSQLTLFSGGFIPQSSEVAWDSAIFNTDYMISTVRNHKEWRIDLNRDNSWNSQSDLFFEDFGKYGDIFVGGDWNNDSHKEVSAVRPDSKNTYLEWRLDTNGNGKWEPGIDAKEITFGKVGDIPVSGKWVINQKEKVGVVRVNGQYLDWYLDTNGNGIWDPGIDIKITTFGKVGDIPMTGDWNNDSKTEVGTVRVNGQYLDWYQDTNGNGVWDPGIDTKVTFGKVGDIPITGKWIINQKDKIGTVRINGQYLDWRLDTNGNGIWEPGIDTLITSYGEIGDIPVVLK